MTILGRTPPAHSRHSLRFESEGLSQGRATQGMRRRNQWTRGTLSREAPGSDAASWRRVWQ